MSHSSIILKERGKVKYRVKMKVTSAQVLVRRGAG